MPRHLGLFVAAFAVSSVLVLSVDETLAAQPEQRVVELVSQLPPGIQDTGVCGQQHHGCDIRVTPDGRQVFFALNQGPLYERTGTQTTLISTGPLGPGVVGTDCYPYGGPCDFRVSEDGRAVAFSTPTSLVPEDTGGIDIYLRSGGATRLVSTVKPPPDPFPYRYAYLAGMSADGSRVLYHVSTFENSSPLYEWTNAGVTKFPSNAMPAPDAYVLKDGDSADGRRVFFETSAALVPQDANGLTDVYERTLDGQIKLISADASGHAAGIYDAHPSSDGSRVFFTTKASLVPEDTDGNMDLYEREGDKLTLLTPGTDSSFVYYLAASKDGTRVFFETEDSLSPLDTDRHAVDVYERVNGQTELISTSSLLPNAPLGANFAYPNGITPDGTHAFFQTDEPFVSDDKDSCYRSTDPAVPLGCNDLYERVGNTTRLVSTGPAGTNANYESGSFLGVSADGQRVIFSTSEPLVAGDHDTCDNGYGPPGCEDIYQRYNGTTTLLSSGPTDDQGNCQDLPDYGCPSFVGTSPTGRTVYFQTRQSLTPDDTDGGLNDIYVSRVAGPGCQPKSNGKSPNKCN